MSLRPWGVVLGHRGGVRLASPGESVVLCSGQPRIYVLAQGACFLISQALFLRPTEVSSRKAQAPPS